jgi:hypothetical protein
MEAPPKIAHSVKETRARNQAMQRDQIAAGYAAGHAAKMSINHADV